MTRFFSLLLPALLLTGCCTRSTKEVVAETYIHKYGAPVCREDWIANGRDGQVVQQRRDGVTVKRSYRNGVLEGNTSYSFPNSTTLHICEVYNAGALVARTSNYPSGAPMEEERYQNGQSTQMTHWYEDGTPASVENYDMGRIVSGEYRTPLNAIEAQVVDGIGTRLFRNNKGELMMRDLIRGGELVERICYFASGDPSAIIPYQNGQIHGTRLTFFEGGLPNTVEQWVHGKQEGLTIVYQNGEKASEIPYMNGEKEGVELRFRDGAEPVEEVSWKAGVQHGPRRLLSVQGETTEWYHKGELVSRPTFERLNLPR